MLEVVASRAALLENSRTFDTSNKLKHLQSRTTGKDESSDEGLNYLWAQIMRTKTVIEVIISSMNALKYEYICEN